MYWFHPPRLNKYSDYAFYSPENGGFSKHQCEKILSLWDGTTKNHAITGGSPESLLTHIPNDKRKSHIQWIHWSEEVDWIFAHLANLAMDCNSVRYRFQLNGFLEAIQMTEYKEGDHYDWHTDHGDGEFSVRKLSIVVQLSDPSNYEGGNLQVHGKKVECIDQGTVTFFPSFAAHKVHPVTKGTRYSLVAWLTGEPFR